jgi:hypothetical protein
MQYLDGGEGMRGAKENVIDYSVLAFQSKSVLTGEQCLHLQPSLQACQTRPSSLFVFVFNFLLVMRPAGRAVGTVFDSVLYVLVRWSTDEASTSVSLITS